MAPFNAVNCLAKPSFRPGARYGSIPTRFDSQDSMLP